MSVPFTLILERDTALEEIVTVNTISGTNVTSCTRGVDGTSAVAHNAGAAVEHGVSARDFTEPQAHIGAASGVHGLTGSVVGTSDTQTLTNKAISGAANTLTAVPKAAITGAPAGALVGDTDAQTLTNKTMSGASNTFSNIAQAATHSSPDTDTATSALHHTLGPGANQAAPGTPTSASKYPLGRVGSTVLAANYSPGGPEDVLIGSDTVVLAAGRRYRVGVDLCVKYGSTGTGDMVGSVYLNGSTVPQGGNSAGTLVTQVRFQAANRINIARSGYAQEEIVCANAGGDIVPGTYYILLVGNDVDSLGGMTYLGSATPGQRCRALIEDIGPQ